MTGSTGMVCTLGTTEDNTRGTGSQESNTERVFTVKDRRSSSRRERESGRMERGLSGWTSSSNNERRGVAQGNTLDKVNTKNRFINA